MKKAAWNRFVDIVSPRHCLVCGGRTNVKDQYVCAECIAALPPTGYLADPYDNMMARMLWGRLPIERAAALFFYRPQTEPGDTIYALKYHSMKEVGVSLGRILAIQALKHDFFDGIDCIIPIPLAPEREQERGYNQSLMIALGISEITGIAVENDVVVRIHHKTSQALLGAYERWENVSGAFRLQRPDAIAGRHVLLVDDVMTTGATIITCGEACMIAEDVKFSILTLGRTDT